MAFSGGVYTLPTPALVPGQTVSSSENNTVRNDMAASFNLTFLRNGTSTATANLPMGGYKLTGLGVATTIGDALSYNQAAVVSNLTDTALTITRVPYVSTGGLLIDSANFTFDGTTLTAGGFSTSGNIAAATASISGNITVSGGTANGVAYLNGSKVLTTGSALTFNGYQLTVNTTTNVGNLTVGSNGISQNALGFIDSNTSGRQWAIGPGVGTGSGGSFGMYDVTGTNVMSLYTAGASGSWAWYAAGSEQMRLTSTGLGIGTSSPMGKLDVTGSNGKLILTNGNTAGGVKISAFNAAGNANGYLAFEGFSAEYARFDSSGNLGLGVTPSAWGNSFKAVEFSTGVIKQQTNGSIGISNNIYYNGTNWIYKTTSQASFFDQYQGQFFWGIAPSGTAGTTATFTQAMTLDASGNLGVGITSPSTKVHANVNSAGGTVYPLYVSNNATSSTEIAGVAFTDGSNIKSSIRAAVYGTDYMAFCVGSNTERMRIDSSGNLLVGTTSNSANGKMAIYGSWSGGSGAGIVTFTSVTTNAQAAVFYNNLGLAGSINTNGTACSYNTSSDYRLKENIQPMQGALDVVAQLNPVTYTWKADGSDGQGFIAHELQAVVPDCVTGEKDAVDAEGKPVYQGIDTSFLVATLTKAIQELKAELDATKAEVAALKGN